MTDGGDSVGADGDDGGGGADDGGPDGDVGAELLTLMTPTCSGQWPGIAQKYGYEPAFQNVKVKSDTESNTTS